MRELCRGLRAGRHHHHRNLSPSVEAPFVGPDSLSPGFFVTPPPAAFLRDQEMPFFQMVGLVSEAAVKTLTGKIRLCINTQLPSPGPGPGNLRAKWNT